ncbi:hypothetical protein [Endozoicomonas lisbonensis]|uniref:N-acetyltransferase domain-containing protein n=1 Tax=Endozoicomonas lisbonensis TaxID=3120522 RepID=A0ABV2SG61_9GAMM
MSFLYNACSDRCYFKHKKSKRVFQLERIITDCSNNNLILRFYEGETETGSLTAGFGDNPRIKEEFGKFYLEDIFFKNNYQGIGLGNLSIYLLIMEVRVNGGEYLYVSAPYLSALGFYIGIGFYPDPDEAALQQPKDRANATRKSAQGFGDFTRLFLNERLNSAKYFGMWKGSVEIIKANISEKVLTQFEAYYQKPSVG